ncbi:MAG: SRPBCC family protein [Phycisphaeraceae bacterium]|nr:SRPBCC family protein [Phycisphaeraceae bacterium]
MNFVSDRRPTGHLHELRREQIIPRSLEESFEFFADAWNLEAITPPWLRFRIITPRPIDMREGAIIDYRLRLWGIPIRWRTRIEAWEPPLRFVDRQIRGPYRWWWHEHTLEPHPEGTLMRDRVEYRAAFDVVATPLVVRRAVETIFDYRLTAIAKIFAPAGERGVTPASPRLQSMGMP